LLLVTETIVRDPVADYPPDTIRQILPKPHIPCGEETRANGTPDRRWKCYPSLGGSLAFHVAGK